MTIAPAATISLPRKQNRLPMPRRSMGWDLAAMLLVFVMGALMVTSAWDDSPCNDEPEHITAGYLYLTAQNYQLNSWHPPLSKDLAALPLLALDLKSPLDSPKVKERIWRAKNFFFYNLGNDAQLILRTARMPIILMTMGFCIYFYCRLRREYDSPTALVALTILTACPTLLAHGRLATSDVAAAAAFFVCLMAFIDYLRKPSLRSLVVVALVVGIAQLVKFSLIFVYPVFFLIGLLHLASVAGNPDAGPEERLSLRAAEMLCLRLLLVFAMGMVIVACVYQWHTANLPPDFQRSYNMKVFERNFDAPIPAAVSAAQGIPCLRGFSWYLTGLNAQRLHLQYAHTRVTYLFGEFMADTAKPWYFPTLLVTKEPLAFLLMAVGACLLGMRALIKVVRAGREEASAFACREFVALASLIFIGAYFLAAVFSNLNIGIRHLMPIFPFLYLVVARVLVKSVKQVPASSPRRLRSAVMVTALLAWGYLSSASSWPGYLAYFNELAGGKAGGAAVALDSNYDWGTDLLRLRKYLDAHKVSTVYLLHHVRSRPAYYLGEAYRPLELPDKLPAGSLIAMSATSWRKILWDKNNYPRMPIAANRLKHLPPAFTPESMQWFYPLAPIGRAGDSILLFRAP